MINKTPATPKFLDLTSRPTSAWWKPTHVNLKESFCINIITFKTKSSEESGRKVATAFPNLFIFIEYYSVLYLYLSSTTCLRIFTESKPYSARHQQSILNFSFISSHKTADVTYLVISSRTYLTTIVSTVSRFFIFTKLLLLLLSNYYSIKKIRNKHVKWKYGFERRKMMLTDTWKKQGNEEEEEEIEKVSSQRNRHVKRSSVK